MSPNLNKVVIREADGPKGSPFLSNMVVSGDKVYFAGAIVISVTIYLSSYSADFGAMNEAYIEAFGRDTAMPVRACVGVAALPLGCAVEMSIIAAKRE
ncbi:hypothetical protein EHS25_005344 [Saitozyma podzolica]|uniref:Uncharacterized protein n=1 Tax=Saitozyma podzolica TaxID=1890683 RepID=A0A427XZ22_9TREE|nr:hypothetical protein EHS25_005344 [Saitozyma podzolica]